MISGIIETISSFILLVIGKTSYLGVFFLMALESANIPIPSEIIMPFSGFLVAQGFFSPSILLRADPELAVWVSFWLVVFLGALGNLSGSLFSYWLGYLVRTDILKWNSQKISEKTEKAVAWLDKFGDAAILISRVLPVVRTFISFPLGVLKTKSLRRFSILTFIGSFIWSAFLTYLGFILGKNWGILEIYFRKFDYLILILILAAIGWWLWRHFRSPLTKL